jgi:hypothetical protein
VGVVRDLMPGDIQDARQDGIYASIFQVRPYGAAHGSIRRPLSMAPDVRAAVARVDPDLSLYETSPCRMRRSRKQVLGVTVACLGVRAGALLLTASASVTAFAVAARTREFGIQPSARPAGTCWDSSRQSGGTSGPVSLRTLLVRPHSWIPAAVDFIAVPGAPGIINSMIACLGLTAALVVARRAATVDPVRRCGNCESGLRKPRASQSSGTSVTDRAGAALMATAPESRRSTSPRLDLGRSARPDRRIDEAMRAPVPARDLPRALQVRIRAPLDLERRCGSSSRFLR